MDVQLLAAYSRPLSLRLTTAFFAAALFTSAALLFWVQPVVAKMILPLLGGSPSVWNTCMVFFQALLLAGYAYSLLISQRLRLKNQALLHIALMLGAGLFLPFAISEYMVGALLTQTSPTLWLLGVLLLTVGFPFFVLSATAPLLQRWFSHSGHRSATDPYYLYAVSNAGSMLSLLAFPFLLEPTLNLQKQAYYWAFGYLALAVLICCCAVIVSKKRLAPHSHSNEEVKAAKLTIKARLEWVVLAVIPSSLMLGVTTYVATDVASVPLIWIVPLWLYLLTFILAFAKRQIMSLRLAAMLLPAAIVCLGFIVILQPAISPWILVCLHLGLFFLAAFICHRRIALSRPPVTRLAEYYLCISLGGVVGGVINALAAPLIFSIPLEYPLAILVACFVRPGTVHVSKLGPMLQIGFPVFLLLQIAGLSLVLPGFGLSRKVNEGLILCIPLALAYLVASRRRYLFGLSLLAVMIGSYAYFNTTENSMATVRNFFGVWRVSSDYGGTIHRLRHGTTFHGLQFRDGDRKCIATAYYHKAGPLGQIFAWHNGKSDSRNVAAIGLGAGTIITYSLPGETWHFYEIDPAIVTLATDARYFKFLSDCSAAPYKIILGDARLRLKEAPAGNYDLLILDAFSSDSVPAHLVTTEALDLYLSKLAPNGIIAFHVSNRYLNLEPLLSGLSARLAAPAFIREDKESDFSGGKYASTWVVIPRSQIALSELAKDSRWRSLKGSIVWSDDFSNILDLMK